MTPHSITDSQSVLDPVRSTGLITRRLDRSDRFFGLPVIDALRSWADDGRSVTLLTLEAAGAGFLVGCLRWSSEAPHARFELHRVTTGREIEGILRAVGDLCAAVGVCSGTLDEARFIEGLVSHRTCTLRTGAELATFRKEALGRDDLIEPAVRADLLEDAYARGGFYSHHAEELMLSDLIAMALSGPDGGVTH